MPTHYIITGTVVPARARQSYRLRQVIADAVASEAAVDLLRELALGQQPERPLTISFTPRWASATLEAAHG